MKFLIPAMALSAMLLCFGCEKEEPATYEPPVPELLDNYRFETGSTWTYENEDGNQDIVEMVEEQHQRSWASKFQTFRHQWYDLHFSSTYRGPWYIALFDKQIRLSGAGRYGGDAGQQIFAAGVTSSSGDIEYFPTLEVCGHTYANVQRFHARAGDSTTTIPFVLYQDVEFFWAPKVGIIKRIDHDSLGGTTTWELLPQ